MLLMKPEPSLANMTLNFPHHTHKRLKLARWLFPVLLCWITTLAHSSVLDNKSTTSSQVPALTQTTDFLPVHEAYQLEIEVRADKLLLHWFITEGYFLYGEKFKVALDQNNAPVAFQLQKEKGEVAYDNYFEHEVERFYHNTTLTILLPNSITAQQKMLALSVDFQGCAEAGLCYPPETLYYNIDLAAHKAAAVNSIAAMPSDAQVNLNSKDVSPHENNLAFLLMFVFALLGGLILNLMPCVFPVLSIKLLSFARSTESANHLKHHSWFYTLGVLSTFTLTALLLMVLRNAGASIGWGFQLQSPIFIACLALLFLILGLSLSGFIDIGTQWMGVGQQMTTGDHYRSSFFTGVLAVIVASPCSVPFMGVALGYALTQPALSALIIFLGLGIGLASPFLVFAYVPGLIQHLPKPGEWMEKLKHWLALPLYLSTIWLLWVLWHQLMAPTHDTVDANQYWEKYSSQTLTNYLEKNEPVFIELTADWCITCLVNEKTALTRSAVLGAMKEKQIHYLRGDWTNGDAEITALLGRYQRGGVPLYIYYGKDKSVTLLPQILTEQMVLDKLGN